MGSCKITCTAGATDCGGSCVNPNADDANCGACGVKCTGNDKCVAGACKCPEGNVFGTCGGRCVNKNQDHENCGSCGHACDPGMACDGTGQCALTCATGFPKCGGQCIDPTTSDRFCGASADCAGMTAGVDCTATGKVCVAGSCHPPSMGSIFYEGYFLANTPATAQQCTDFKTFIQGLHGTFTSIRLSGSSSVGYACAEANTANMIANAMRTQTSVIVTCGAQNWQYCATDNGGTLWVNGGTLCATNSCGGTGQAILRPCVSDPSFTTQYAAGVDTTACNGPTQSAVVEFHY
jgi:hypothetical protein